MREMDTIRFIIFYLSCTFLAAFCLSFFFLLGINDDIYGLIYGLNLSAAKSWMIGLMLLVFLLSLVIVIRGLIKRRIRTLTFIYSAISFISISTSMPFMQRQRDL